MIFDRRLAAALAALFWLFIAGTPMTSAAATLDRATCSDADKAGGDPTKCSGQEQLDSTNQEINHLYDIGAQVLISVSGTNDIVATTSPTTTSLVDGALYQLKPANTITGATRLNLSSVGLKALVSSAGGALGSGDLQSTTIYLVRYYASLDEFRVLSTLGTGTASASNAYVTVGNTGSLSAERAITAGQGLTFSDAGVNSTYTLFLRYSDTLAGNPALGANECVFSSTAAGGGFICEGSVADAFEGNFKFIDVAGADSTQTLMTDATVAGGDLTGNYPSPTVAANAVALTTDTTGNYAAGDAEAGNAITGDSATAFFSSGLIEVARGGTGVAPTLDDQVFVATSATTGAWGVLPDSDAAGVILGYDVTTNAWSTKTDDDVPDAADFAALALTGDVTSSGLATTVAANAVALTTDTTGNYAAGDAEAGAALTGDSATAFFAAGTLDAAVFPALTGDVTNTVGTLGTTIAANAVALTTDTTGNYAAGDAEAGAALTGDTATAFFSAGTIEDARIDGSAEADELVLAGDVDGTANANDIDEAAVETELEGVIDLPDLQGILTNAKGGTGDDTSAVTGVPVIAAGNWTYAAGISNLAASSSADLRGVLSDELGTGGALFGLISTMADDLGCTGSQVIRRNAGDTAFECTTPTGGGNAQTADPLSQFAATTSAQLAGVISDEFGSGALSFLGAPGADDQVYNSTSTSAGAWIGIPDSDGATQKLQYDTTTNAFSAGTDDDVGEAGDFGALALTGDVTSSGLATTIAANAVALTTDTTGFYALSDAEGGNALDLTCTACLGTTEIAALDTADVTTGAWADARVDGSLEADEVNPTLGTQTQGNFVSALTAGAGLAVTHTPSEGSSGAYALNYSDQGADPALVADACQFTSNATTPGVIVCEGDTADTFESRIVITEPTADRAFTIPNADSNAVQPLTCGSTDKVSAISALGVVTCTADAGAAGGDSITVNTTAVVDPDFDSATPAAAAGGVNITFQTASNDISAYVPAVLGLKTIALLSGAGTIPTGGGIAGCTAAPDFDSGSNDVFMRQCSFSASADNAIYYTIPMPKSADETVDLQARIDWTSTTTTDATDDVIWAMACVAFSNDDAINGNAFPAVDTVTDTQTAAGDFLSSGNITAITPAGTWAENDAVVCRLTRDADAAGDNFNGTADLINVQMFATVNALRDN